MSNECIENDIYGSPVSKVSVQRKKKEFKMQKPISIVEDVEDDEIISTENIENVFDKIDLNYQYEDLGLYSIIAMKAVDHFRAFLNTFNNFVYEKNADYILTIEPDECFNLIKKIVGCKIYYYDRNSYYFKFNNKILGIFTCRENGLTKTHFDINLYGENTKDVIEFTKTIYDAINSYILDEEYVNLRWLYKDKHGDVNSHNFQHNYKDVILPEAYPFIKNLEEYIHDFVTGDETLLIFQGIPGTGKTRLIRHLLREMSKYYKEENSNNCYFGFTNNPELINNEEFYMHFLLDDNYVGMILEDSDVNIKARKGLGDNATINKLLFASDGFIPHNKKIILSTNLDVQNIDNAIVRSGRCYDFVQTRKLTVLESEKFLKAYNIKFQKNIQVDIFKEDVALCDIYRAIKEVGKNE